MQEKSIEPRYGVLHKSFHWVILGLLVVQYIIGSVMPHIGRNTLDEGWVAWHLSVGVAIMVLLVLRWLWRLARPVPLPAMPAWQTHLATLTHAGLYLLIAIMTVLGWAAASFRGWSVTLFGIVPLPPLAAKGTLWAHTAGDIHDVLVYVLLALIVLHIAAALYHYFVVKDRILQRMLSCG